MGKALSLISKLHESGSRFIVESLKANGIMDFSPSHGDILAALYTKNRITMKNEKKLTKGCEKDHSPPLEPPRLPRLVCIYPHHGVHISPLR